MADYLLRNARLPGFEDCLDVALADGKILTLGKDLKLQAKESWNLGADLLLPGLIDAHVHLDKTYYPLQNQTGSLREAIDVWLAHKASLDAESYRQRALKAVQRALLNGTTAMRSHIDIDAKSLGALETLLVLREDIAELMDLQLVALGNPGVSEAENEAMRQALMLGADLVGGAPALYPDPKAAIDAAFELAEAFDKDLDLHIDETEDPNMLTLEYLAEQTLVRGFMGRVSAGHCCSLAFVDDERAARVIDKVAEARLNIITLPSCNLVLMGRAQQPTPRGVTRVKELLNRGVNVVAASDNVQDPFNPFGDYDPLMAAHMNAHAAHMTGTAELNSSLNMVTLNAAKALRLKNYGLFEGAQADLVVLEAGSSREALLSPVRRRASFKKGRLVVKQNLEVLWSKEQLWT